MPFRAISSVIASEISFWHQLLATEVELTSAIRKSTWSIAPLIAATRLSPMRSSPLSIHTR